MPDLMFGIAATHASFMWQNGIPVPLDDTPQEAVAHWRKSYVQDVADLRRRGTDCEQIAALKHVIAMVDFTIEKAELRFEIEGKFIAVWARFSYEDYLTFSDLYGHSTTHSAPPWPQWKM